MTYFGPWAEPAGDDVIGVACKTMPRGQATTALSAGTSGTLYCRAVALPPGLLIQALDYWQVGPATNPAHAWMCILNNDGQVQAVTGDQLTAGQSANTYYRFSLVNSQPWQVPPYSSDSMNTGRYFMIGLMLAASVMGTVLGAGSTFPTTPAFSGVSGVGHSGIVGATGGTGLTSPPAVGSFLTLTPVAGTSANFYAAASILGAS